MLIVKNLVLPKVSTTLAQNHAFYQVIKLFNKLDQNIRKIYLYITNLKLILRNGFIITFNLKFLRNNVLTVLAVFGPILIRVAHIQEVLRWVTKCPIHKFK